MYSLPKFKLNKFFKFNSFYYNFTKEHQFSTINDTLKNPLDQNTLNIENGPPDKNSLDNTEKLEFIQFNKKGIPVKANNYYDSLGVPHNANLQSIRKNYLMIARKYHPDKDIQYLEYFTYICAAYDTLKDTQKRAIYDEELLNKDPAWIIKYGRIRINIIYFFLIAVGFYLSPNLLGLFNVWKSDYFCPLGESKYEIFDLKNNEKNLKLIEFIESTKDNLSNAKKIAEDDEYEYFTVDETKKKQKNHPTNIEIILVNI